MSRATELNFRHPREITDAIYNPDVSAQIQSQSNSTFVVCVYLGDVYREATDFQDIACQLRENRLTSALPIQSRATSRVPAE